MPASSHASLQRCGPLQRHARPLGTPRRPASSQFAWCAIGRQLVEPDVARRSCRPGSSGTWRRRRRPRPRDGSDPRARSRSPSWFAAMSATKYVGCSSVRRCGDRGGTCSQQRDLLAVRDRSFRPVVVMYASTSVRRSWGRGARPGISSDDDDVTRRASSPRWRGNHAGELRLRGAFSAPEVEHAGEAVVNASVDLACQRGCTERGEEHVLEARKRLACAKRSDDRVGETLSMRRS